MSEPQVLRLAPSVASVEAGRWDALVAGAHPFLSHRFLSALEASQSVGADTGWTPAPLLVEAGGEIEAALPLYVKTHSQGEYIFDHAWAEAYARAGGDYYPKLQVAVPFTPVTGPRFLGPRAHWPLLAEGAADLARQNGLSSLHITFCTEDEAAALAGHAGFLARDSLQFHWHNPGYRDFEDFLATLSSRKRKAIRREREGARALGLRVETVTGASFTPAHWQAFWAFYRDTGARKWGHPYLTRAAFDLFGATMAEDMVLFMAYDGARPVAGALNFIGRDALYGRWWGALGAYPFLHFELCYYRAMEWAIARGLSRVEAGAQGEHKLARGYVPARCHSLHWFADAGFSAAVARFLADERAYLAELTAAYAAQSPYRQL